MDNNSIDVDIYPSLKGWNVVISYYYYSRNKNDKKITSVTTYTWYTECAEIIDYLQTKRTKVFYSQIRALTRNFGNKERDIYKNKK